MRTEDEKRTRLIGGPREGKETGRLGQVPGDEEWLAGDTARNEHDGVGDAQEGRGQATCT